jgi:phosphoribosylaminoimidazolecarboxamide formyltransferase / IMP cyclohydrolase
MQKKIQSALISVFYKDGIDVLAKTLVATNVTIYSTGGTQQFLEENGIACIGVETVTNYPSILGGRVKTLHPKMFGGILARRDNEQDIKEMVEYAIPEIDLVIVDLYPFKETLKQVLSLDEDLGEAQKEALIIEKIDIGGPSMIRAAAKNCSSVVSIAHKEDYAKLNEILIAQNGCTTMEQRKAFAAKAFEVVMHYDIDINNYFNENSGFEIPPLGGGGALQILRYGENPHQQGVFYGDLNEIFTQLNGKELSYNNLVDVDAAIQLYVDLKTIVKENESFFAIIKHTNVCGVAISQNHIFTKTQSVSDIPPSGGGGALNAWETALAADPESAFGGVLVCNSQIDEATANAINEIFFEVLIAPSFSVAALAILQTKKNRILLQVKNTDLPKKMIKSLLNGRLIQGTDEGNFAEWNETGGRSATELEKEDLIFANIVCKHLKSNAIALVKNKQLIGKGCGQTSRIDALRQAVEKAKQFNFDLNGAVMASDAFFPFNDCVQLGHQAGITAFIQPGGSIRDKDSIQYCTENNLAMVITGLRHFKH